MPSSYGKLSLRAQPANPPATTLVNNQWLKQLPSMNIFTRDKIESKSCPSMPSHFYFQIYNVQRSSIESMVQTSVWNSLGP